MTRLGCLILCAAPALAEAQDSAAWILANTEDVLRQDEVATIAIGPEVFAVDPLTFDISYDWPAIPVPAGPARFVVFWDAALVSYSKAALVFSDAPPVCGEEVSVMGVDTGTAAFLDRAMAAALDRAADVVETGNCNLYDCLLAEEMGDRSFAKLLNLPDGTRFPSVSTGGDGGFPVVMLRGADGQPTALYADFLGRNADGEWLLPPACPKPLS